MRIRGGQRLRRETDDRTGDKRQAALKLRQLERDATPQDVRSQEFTKMDARKNPELERRERACDDWTNRLVINGPRATLIGRIIAITAARESILKPLSRRGVTALSASITDGRFAPKITANILAGNSLRLTISHTNLLAVGRISPNSLRAFGFPSTPQNQQSARLYMNPATAVAVVTGPAGRQVIPDGNFGGIFAGTLGKKHTTCAPITRQAGPFIRKLHNGAQRPDRAALPVGRAAAMHYLSADTLTQAILAVSVLMGLVIVGVLIVQSFRGGMKHSGPTTGQMLANFEEMRSRGDISDADYRKIKSVLGAELHGELKDDKDKA